MPDVALHPWLRRLILTLTLPTGCTPGANLTATAGDTNGQEKAESMKVTLTTWQLLIGIGTGECVCTIEQGQDMTHKGRQSFRPDQHNL